MGQKKTDTHIRISTELYKWVKEEAKRTRRTIAAVIELAVEAMREKK